MIDLPRTLLDAVRYFSDLDVCDHYMRRIKWPDGKVTCPHCGEQKIGEIRSRRRLQCKSCRKQFSVKVGTIFEDSPLGLDKWLPAIWSVATDPVSSRALGELLGIEQKSAWSMLTKIRIAKEIAMLEYKVLDGYLWHGTPAYRVGSDGSMWSRKIKSGNRWTIADDWQPMSPLMHHDGYRYVTLYREGKSQSRKVAVIVAENFCGPKPQGAGRIEARHKNGDRADDRAGNLEWGTTADNAKDRDNHGRTARGERNGWSKLDDSQIADLLSLRGVVSQSEAGRRFGISQVHVGRIWAGKRHASSLT